MASEKYMAEDDLRHFWSKLEDRLKAKVNTNDSRLTLATSSKNGLLSSSDFTKLAGIAENANNYVHPTSSGNKHIPSGGSAGQILRWSADGTAVWGNDVNTTYEVFTGATASVAGASGLVPAPGAGKNTSFLRGDGTWAVPQDTTYSNATQSNAGLMSSQDKTKLDGIADNANNYTHPTTSGNKHIPSGGSANQTLIWSADGTAQWGSIDIGNTTGTLSVDRGGTGATTADAARTNLGAAAENHTHDNATQETAGFMSITDKQKLDSINPDSVGGGFVQFDEDSDIPIEQRVANTLYGRIVVDYSVVS